MLNVFWADADRLVLPSSAPISAYRKQKISAIKHDRTRRCSLCAELLLIKAVRAAAPDFPLPLDLDVDEFGKPRLVGGEYEFSLSHSSHFAACALSDAAVGLDIQILTKCDERLVRRFLTKGEQDHVLASKDRDAAFTRLWCRKESFLKAIGIGLRLPLDSFEASDANAALIYDGTAFSFKEYRSDDLFFCVCAPSHRLPDQLCPQQIELPL